VTLLRRFALTALCLCVAFAGGAARAKDAHGQGEADAAPAAPSRVRPEPPPRRDGDLPDLVRDLNAVQNRIVMGDPLARAASLKRFELVERALAEIPAEDWAQERNVRAAATYLLCGGSARTLHRLFQNHAFRDEDAPLLAASLAYAEGRKQEALRQFSNFDPRHFPATLGGHIALVVGSLLLGEDNERARKMFDLARLLAPGSIVEEAALRRQITIVDAAEEPEKATLLQRRYVARYLKSPFARTFWDDLATTTFRVAPKLPPEKFARFVELFDAAPPQKSFELHIGLARVALLTGALETARLNLDKAAPLVDTPAARGRVTLYEGAYRAMSGDFAEGLAAMLKLDSNTLPPQDLQLQRVVAATVSRLQASEPETPAPLSAEETPRIALAAQEALEQSDLVLKKAIRR
jgi:chemotaxis protein MotC